MYASKELGAKLWELSKWIPDKTHFDEHGDKVFDYSLDYLLRKLPKIWPQKVCDHGPRCHHNFVCIELKWNMKTEKNGTWWAGYLALTGANKYTPEDAACKLAIQLFKQNILTPENE